MGAGHREEELFRRVVFDCDTLVRAAEGEWDDADEACSVTDRAVSQGRSFARVLKQITDKMQLQHENLHVFVSHLQVRLGVFEESLAEFRHAEGAIMEEFNAVLARLHQNVLDTDQLGTSKELWLSVRAARLGLAARISSEGSTVDTGDSCNSADGSGRVAPKTLFDFVDQHSIETLKNEITHQVSELSKRHQRCQEILGSIEERVKISQDAVKQCIIEGQRELSDPDGMVRAESVRLEMQTLRQDIAFAKLKIAQHHKNIAGLGTGASEGLFQLAQERSKEMHSLVKTMATQRNMIWERMGTHLKLGRRRQSVYSTILATFAALDRLGPDLNALLVEFAAIDMQYQGQTQTASIVVRECHNLISWYDMFEVSYDKLLEEVVRRKQVAAMHTKYVKEVTLRLNELGESEDNERERFNREYGKFLPNGICPSISQPVGRYHIQRGERHSPVVPSA